MVITRKIEIFVCEDNADLRKEYYQKLYDTRNVAVKVANMCVSHLFALDNTMPYLSDDDRKQIQFLGVKGNPASRQNVPYVAASEAFKGKVDMGMVSCVINNVQKMYSDDCKKGMWDHSLRSYKGNMPVPYKADRFLNLRFVECINKEGKRYDGCFFTLTGIPFQIRFGRDRSGNRIIIERVLQQFRYNEQQQGIEHPLLPGEKDIKPVNTGYKLCTSSFAFEKKVEKNTGKKKQKLFLYLCVDIPTTKVEVDPKKVVYAYLGIAHPIQCMLDEKCTDIYNKDARWINIDSAENFLHRRVQIQEALRRCQANCKYNKGGKGRQRKMQAAERFAEKEKNYVDTRLHQYSRELVDIAISHGCGTICLVNQKPREDQAKEDAQKGNPFVLRNWSYFGLKQKIQYKCKMSGIKLLIDGKEESEDDECQ